MFRGLLQKNYLLSISLLMFSITYARATNFINDEDLIGLVIYLFIITSLQYLAIQYIFKNSLILKNIAFSFVLLINAQMILLDFIPEISALKFFAEISVYIIFIFLSYLLSSVISKSKKSLIILPIITIFSSLFLLKTYTSSEPAPFIYKNNLEKIKPNIEYNVFNKQFNDQNYNISFFDKPDLIVISFESLVSEAHWKMHTKRKEQIPMHTLIENNMASFKNHFSEEIETYWSISSLFSLTPDSYYRLERNAVKHRNLDERFGVVSGRTPSPLTHILRENGYEISTFTELVDAWGMKKGPYVDNYYHAPFKKAYVTSVCQISGVRTGDYSFLGFCIVRDTIIKVIEKIFPDKNNPNLMWTQEFGSMDVNDSMYSGVAQAYHQIEDIIQKSDDTNRPQFLFAHLKWPHASPTAYTPNYRNKSDGSFRRTVLHYEKNSMVSAHFLNQIIELFKDRKKDTIIYVFGDHGMFLSKHLNKDQDTFEDQHFSWTIDGDFILGDEIFDINKLVEDNPQKTIEIFDKSSLDKTITYTRSTEPYRTIDIYGTYGGLYSSHQCANYALNKNLQIGYITPQLTMHSLITCLADEKSKKSNYIKDFKREYVITSQNLNIDDRDIDREHIGFDRLKYENFLYE